MTTSIGPTEGMQITVTDIGAKRHGVRAGLTGTIVRVTSPDARWGQPAPTTIASVLVDVTGTRFTADWPTDALIPLVDVTEEPSLDDLAPMDPDTYLQELLKSGRRIMHRCQSGDCIHCDSETCTGTKRPRAGDWRDV